MRWGDVTKSKRYEGLCLGDLEKNYQDLLAKWWWRFEDEKEVLWWKIITSEYGEDKWSSLPKSVPRYCVLGLVYSVQCEGDVFSKGVGFIVGEGKEVRFLWDDWAA